LSCTKIVFTKWEQDLSQLNLLESDRLMGRIARTEHRRLLAEYQKVTGLTQAQKQSSNLLQAAIPFAQAAQKLTNSKKSHSVTEWQAIVRQWDLAIDQIHNISAENPDYVKSRQVIANYQQQVDRAKTRLTEEQNAHESLQNIEIEINNLVQNHSLLNRDQAKAKLIRIEAKLRKIPTGTTVYEQAHDWLESLRKRLNS
jgi:hypothetical protein